MVEWSIKAGLIDGKIPNQLKIVYEPDCASLSVQHAVLRNLKKNNSNNAIVNDDSDNEDELRALQPQISINVPFKRGDKYILLDIGGGTCDVACHEIMGDFEIAEVLHPSGTRNFI